MGVAGYMGLESVSRLAHPVAIQFNEAIPIAAVGLVVNIVSAWLLSTGGHEHDHEHHHDAEVANGHHHDLNLRSAYVHVMADAATSVLAIIALVSGKYLGILWLDPVMGLAGTALVGSWAWSLLRASGRVLLDAEMDAPVVQEVREVLGALPDDVVLRDLHVWRVGKGTYACIVSLAAVDVTPAHVRECLSVHEELVHVTVEVERRVAGNRPPRAIDVKSPELSQ